MCNSGAHRAFDIDIGSIKDIYYRIILRVTYPYQHLHNKETIFFLTDFMLRSVIAEICVTFAVKAQLHEVLLSRIIPFSWIDWCALFISIIAAVVIKV